MNPPKKLTAQQQAEAEAQALHQQSGQQAFREFGSVEELLRHDALHTPVPPSIAHRLQESIHSIPPAPKPWWKRLLGG